MDDGVQMTQEMKDALREGVQKILNVEKDIVDAREDQKSIYEQMKELGVDVKYAKSLVAFLKSEEKNPGGKEYDIEMTKTYAEIWFRQEPAKF